MDSTTIPVHAFDKKTFCIGVKAKYALFTSSKCDEPYSHPFPTSAAVRGFCESILHKPAFLLIPRMTEIVNPGTPVGIRMNCVKQKGVPRNQDVNSENVQKLFTYRSGVEYKFYVDVVFLPREYRWNGEYHEGQECPKKYYEMFQRRVSNGQYYRTPYLGTKECSDLQFGLLDEQMPENLEFKEAGVMYLDNIYDEDLTASQRQMLFDMDKSLFEAKQKCVSPGILVEEEAKRKKTTVKYVFKPMPLPARLLQDKSKRFVKYENKFDLLPGIIDTMLQARHA